MNKTKMQLGFLHAVKDVRKDQVDILFFLRHEQFVVAAKGK